MTYRLSARAEADLTGIWVYSAEEWGVDQADRYVDALSVASILLAYGKSDAVEGPAGYFRRHLSPST
jgi:plasmid stabilization system protein ParE